MLCGFKGADAPAHTVPVNLEGYAIMPDLHSRLSPSSMTRIKACPGSAVLSDVDTGGAAADKGTLLHGLAERMLKGETVNATEFPDQDSMRSVQEFVDYVRCFKEHGETQGIDQTTSQIILEGRIVSKSLPDHGGTIDVLILSDTHIHVIDYKSGFQPVSAKNNDQGRSYLALANEKYPGRKRFFFSIVQPAVYGAPQCREYSLDEIEAHDLDVLLLSEQTHKKAGEHCKWCPLLKTCEVREAYTIQLAQTDFDKEEDWDGEKCKEILGMSEVFSALATEAKKRIQAILMENGIVEGWRLAKSLGNRAWKDEEVTASTLLEKGLTEDKIYNKKLISPAQLEKFSKAYKPLVSELSHRPDNGVTAVTEDSKLPIYDPAELFGDIEL